MTTALALIKRAMSEIGVLGAGATLDAGDKQLVFDALNNIVSMWNTSSLWSYATADATVTISPGTSSVTIGPGKSINVTAPTRIGTGMFFRVGTIDYPVRLVDQASYAGIWDKSITGTYPAYAYYDRAGTIQLWPVTGTPGELHVPLDSRLSAFADTTTDYALADGVERALGLTLAEDIADMFQRPLSANLARRAAGARRAVRRGNVVVPKLSVHSDGPSGMVFGAGLIDGGGIADNSIGAGGGDYLVYT